MKPKSNIVLVNLGGVEKLLDIPVFLFNMFNDYNILHIKQPLRLIAAFILTTVRSKETYKIYKHTKSPIFKITSNQAKILSKILNKNVKFSFSYSIPLLKNEKNTVLLPMYNFYSHATHGKILRKTRKVLPPFCIYKDFFYLIEKRVKKALSQIKSGNTAIILSAHSMPEQLLKETNDPYKNDLEVFTNYLKKRIGIPIFLSFQSKLGPIKWLEPSTRQMIIKLSEHFKNIVVLPISFTTENTETLYEIDTIYAKLAKSVKIKKFIRVSCFNTQQDFIHLLVEILDR